MKTLLQISNLNKRYGARIIFDDAAVTICDEHKIGVIGRNGAGKSTLCRILTGEEEAESVLLEPSSELKLAYLEQHDAFKLDETVIGFLERYTGRAEWECGKVAGQFALKGAMLEKPIGELSGGFRTRVKLTAMLLKEPNFLILDEPTNYLDLRTLILLEHFLQEYEGAFMIVSHDREFLARTCNQTLEVENGGMTLYPGSVGEYLIFKEEQKQQVVAFNKGVVAKQKQLQLFVDRFGAKASKATQAKSKMKQIERLKTIDIAHQLGNVKIRIPEPPERKGLALRIEDLAIGYPDKTVAKKIGMDIEQGAHVAVLGDNGQGKTTFLRTISDDLKPLAGDFRWGNSLQIATYAQHVYAAIRPETTVYQYMSQKAAPEVMRQEILNLAGSFLFKGDEVDKKIGVLSGGERARACLAGMLLSKSNVLLLDEPTNHLDFETVEALGNALRRFKGTVFFVSHDRTFVNLVATEIIEVNNGQVMRYPGTYEEYVYYLEKKADEEGAEAPSISGIHVAAGASPGSKNHATPSAVPAKPAAPKLTGKALYEAKKELESEKRKMQTRVKKSEETIEQLKKEYEDANKVLLADGANWSQELYTKHSQLGQRIKDEEAAWAGFVAKATETDRKLQELK
jgi:ATP-binding cassette subfamily F protein 3